MSELNATIRRVTERVIANSAQSRSAYLDLMRREADRRPERSAVSCSVLAHAFAGALEDQDALKEGRGPNIGIVSAYNDMLSAHQPYGRYPDRMKIYAREFGATAQVAGATPAMCDGVTQGEDGMELSLFSRDNIAMATGVALSHQMYDGAALLGICDKIVPGLMMGALRFGHLPAIFVPSGPMPSGISNSQKQATRQQFAAGEVGREELLESELGSYHSPGTCTFFGTANSNQMMLEMMGLHVPGSAFIQPGTKLRQALDRAAVQRMVELSGTTERTLAQVVDEKAIINAAIGLLATGGSTNHAIHIPWNGGLSAYTAEPVWRDETLQWAPVTASRDDTMLRPVNEAFKPDGGMKLLTGNLGRACFKSSAVAQERWTIEAPCRVFQTQADVIAAFKAGELDRDVVVIVRFQGPRANGMPELHALTPSLGVLQDRGHRVALVTDGRMSGASGKVPAAIHCTPEALGGGPLSLLQDGDVVRVCAETGALSTTADLSTRGPAPDPAQEHGVGRELFRMMQTQADGAEQGASAMLASAGL